MFRPAFCLTVLLVAALLMFACNGSGAGAKSASPTEAYKNLFAAVKAKDVEAIKRNASKKTHDLATMQASRSGTPIEAVYENGFTETTMTADLPTLRDERVSGNMGALEVWNSKRSSWEDVPFVLEDGTWKIAAGDALFGSYKSPGLGRDEREKEAANVAGSQTASPGPAANTSVPKVIEVKPQASPAKK